MEKQSHNAAAEIKLIEHLFNNKQLDQFVERVEKYILPHVDVNMHLKGQPKTQQQVQTINQTKPQKDKQQNPKNLQGHSNISKQSENVKAQEKDKHQPSTQQLLKQSPQIQQQKQQIKQPSHSQQILALLKASKLNILQKYEWAKLILYKLEKQMDKISTPMNEKTEWKINKINDTSRLGVKTKGTVIELRYEGLVETNIENLCIMIYLSELYKEWVPFCTTSRTMTQPSPLEKVVLLDFKIPFLTERYAYFHGLAIDRISKNGKLYVYGQGISHEKDLLTKVYQAPKQQYQKKVSKSVVLDAKYFICQISNQGKGKYFVKLYGVIDSHMPLLPERVVSYITKQLGGMIFDKIIKRANNFKNTPWEKELKQNEKREVKNKFYDWLHQRISTWAKSQDLINKQSKI